MPGRFQGKTVIVRGSSQGIGREIAILFAQEGARITITGKTESDVKETRNLLIAANTKEEDIIEVIGDETSQAVHKEIVDLTAEHFGSIDILINNTNEVQDHGFCPDREKGNDEEINLESIESITELALPHLTRSKGEIVLVYNIPALSTSVKSSVAPNSDVDEYVRSLASSCIQHGIRVNAVRREMSWDAPPLTSSSSYHGRSKNLLSDEAIPIAKAVASLAARNSSESTAGNFLTIDSDNHVFVIPIMSINDKN